MIRPLVQYARDEGAPRWRNIVITPEALIAILVVAVFMYFGDRLFSSFPKISDITTGLIAYAAIALGFCVAGLTISLTLPDQDFAARLATTTNDGDKTNSYSDLLFVFSWTAIVHWMALMVLFTVILFVDGSSVLLPPGHSAVRAWALAFTSGLCVYCLCQFLITLITLSQVGSVYIKHLADKHAAKKSQAAPSNSRTPQT